MADPVLPTYMYLSILSVKKNIVHAVIGWPKELELYWTLAKVGIKNKDNTMDMAIRYSCSS